MIADQPEVDYDQWNEALRRIDAFEWDIALCQLRTREWGGKRVLSGDYYFLFRDIGLLVYEPRFRQERIDKEFGDGWNAYFFNPDATWGSPVYVSRYCICECGNGHVVTDGLNINAGKQIASNGHGGNIYRVSQQDVLDLGVIADKYRSTAQNKHANHSWQCFPYDIARRFNASIGYHFGSTELFRIFHPPKPRSEQSTSTTRLFQMLAASQALKTHEHTTSK